jgi:hypothetical protein
MITWMQTQMTTQDEKKLMMTTRMIIPDDKRPDGNIMDNADDKTR